MTKKNFFLKHFEVFFRKKFSDGTSPTLTKQKSRLRILAGRKIPRAVDRNRIKRVAREFFRIKRPLLPDETVVLKVLPSAARTKNEELFQDLSRIL